MSRGVKRREMPEFSISFLDVISCGFGAIVLLLLIAKVVEPSSLEPVETPDDGRVAELQETLFKIRGEAKVLNRHLKSKQTQLSKIKTRVAQLQSSLAKMGDAEGGKSQAQTTEKETLAIALQNLTEEMRRLKNPKKSPSNNYIGGIPVDSEYIIFIVDTSGSMFKFAWPRLRREMVNILNIYPKVKGIQVMNDMGQYMFSSYRDKWIPDTPARRSAVIKRLNTWTPFSNSSPVEGVQFAIRRFYQPDRRISLYVLGDDFTGTSVARVLDTVERINRSGHNNKRLVRIHTIGFPVHLVVRGGSVQSASRFAALMRELSYRNNGTFVALTGL